MIIKLLNQMEDIVEALLNREIYDIPKFDHTPSSLEGQILDCASRSTTNRDLVNKWVETPGDMRLYSFFVRGGYDQIASFFDVRKMLKHKDPVGLYDRSFYYMYRVLCNDKDLKELIKWYEPFAYTGLIHFKFLETGQYDEYCVLSQQFEFTANDKFRTIHIYQGIKERPNRIDVIAANASNNAGFSSVIKQPSNKFYSCHDIDELRELNKFPYPYINIADTGLIAKAIMCFDQLKFHEKTLIINLIKSRLFDWDYYKCIDNKEMLELLCEYFDWNSIYADIDIFCDMLVKYCSDVMIEYFIEKLPGKNVCTIKLQIILQNYPDQVKYFFDKVTQEMIDQLVKNLIK